MLLFHHIDVFTFTSYLLHIYSTVTDRDDLETCFVTMLTFTTTLYSTQKHKNLLEEAEILVYATLHCMLQ